MPDLIASTDGAKAEAMADNSQGPPSLFNGVRKGVRRMLRGGQLFDGSTLTKLAESLANHTASAEIAGRARIRERAKPHVSFAESVDFPSQVVAPERAAAWFRSIAPQTRLHPERFALSHEGRGFQIAATTEQKILEKIHDAIAKRIADGDPINDGTAAVRDILTRAGIGTSDAYPRMVYRTNVMEAYRHGSWDEYKDPDLDDWFPVWQYLGIADGRERMGPLPKYTDHHRHFGLYFPRSVSFFDVRGTGAEDVINCRCDCLPVNRMDWKRLQQRGAVLATR